MGKYYIELIGNKGTSSHQFDERDEAEKFYTTLTQEFKEHILRDRSNITEIEDVCNISIDQLADRNSLGSRIPVIASAVRNEYFEGVCEEILKAADSLYNSRK